MSISGEVEFNHLLNEFFGKGSRIYQYCVHYKVKFHHKLRAKFKNGDELEYVDETGATVKLSEDDIYEIKAIPSFKNFMQNETGPKITCPLDITEFSRNDFTRYLNYDYDENNPDKYSNKQATESLAACERRAAATALHEAKMKHIHGGIATVKETLITNSTTETTPSNVEINCDNELGVGDEGRITDNVPTPCGSSLIVNTGPNSKGGVNIVEENRDDVIAASNNGINCNNGLGIGTNGRGFDIDEEPHPMNQHPIQGNKLRQPRGYPMLHLDLQKELIVVMIIMETPYPMRHHTDHPPS